MRWTQSLLQTSALSRMVPLIVLMVPLYVLFRSLGLLNSLSGVILAEVGFLLPYAIMILAPYFASFPGGAGGRRPHRRLHALHRLPPR